MDQLPELYAVFQGEVASVTEYGAFIKIPGTPKQGLVHKSQMSNCRVDKPSEMVDVGEKVWVKLIGKEKKDDKLKLSLSMKVVNQGTGKDLDPNNVVLDQEARKKCSFRDYTNQKITLEAVLNTVCKKCGCPGMRLIYIFSFIDKKKKRKRKNTDLEASDSTNSDNGSQPARKKAKRKEKNSPSRKRKKKHHKKKHKE
ncbi:hypothetical protein E2320_000486 [Naja naja]|nr:hypothetical protein E2320_000486 [Naja naja]